VPHWPEGPTLSAPELVEDGPAIDALFQATVEATEEAVIDALFTADTLDGRDGHVRHGLPVEEVLALLARSADRR
jgi:D-aminopeptidase